MRQSSLRRRNYFKLGAAFYWVPAVRACEEEEVLRRAFRMTITVDELDALLPSAAKSLAAQVVLWRNQGRTEIEIAGILGCRVEIVRGIQPLAYRP